MPDHIHLPFIKQHSCSWNNGWWPYGENTKTDGARSYLDQRARTHTIAAIGGVTYKTTKALHGDLFIVFVAPVAVCRGTARRRRRRHGWPLPFWYFVRNKQLGRSVSCIYKQDLWTFMQTSTDGQYALRLSTCTTHTWIEGKSGQRTEETNYQT